jgi:tetratricopeptide (TPR) repeat protein
MFSSTSKFGKNAGEFFKNLPGEMAIIPLIFSAAAIVMLWKNFKNLVIFIVLVAAFNLLYAFNYNIVDINTYYLLVFYLLGIILPSGILYLITFGNPASSFNRSEEPKRSLPKTVIVSLVLVIFTAGYNYKENDNSSNYANSEFTVNALNSVENNSVIIAYDWAYLYSASLYLQLAEKQRPDVKIFNIKFLAVNWYLKTITKFYPELYESIKPEAEEYLKVYDQNEKMKAPKLSALVGAFVDKCFLKYPLYITIDFFLGRETKQFFENYSLKPVGFLYKVEAKNSLYDPNAGANTLNHSFRKFEPDNTQKRNLHKVIPGMYFETAYYHYNNKNFEVSLKFLDKALEFDPAFRDALNLKRKIFEVNK